MEKNLSTLEKREQLEYKKKKIGFKLKASQNYIPDEHQIIYRCPICSKIINYLLAKHQLNRHLLQAHLNSASVFAITLTLPSGKHISYRIGPKQAYRGPKIRKT